MSITPLQNHSITNLNPNSNDSSSELKEKALQALCQRDAASLKTVLEKGFNPNTLFTLDSETIDQIFSIDSEEESLSGFLKAFIVHAFFEDKEMSALFIAAYAEDIDSVRLLLEHGADVHFKMSLDEGEPDHCPICIDSGDQGPIIEIIELLHQRGLAIEDLIDPEYLNPLELLAGAKQEKNEELISFLENHGYHLD